MMPIINFCLTVFLGITGVVEAWLSISNAEDRERHIKKLIFSFLIAVAFNLLPVSQFGIPCPTIAREKDYSAIKLSCNTGFGIEYKLSAASDDKWIKYSKPIKVKKNTILYARASLYFLKSEEVSKDIFVSENGLVYFGGADTPGDSVVKINAQYNYENMFPNKAAGNYYAGYEIKKSDIKVIGTTLKGDEKEIYDFKYSPNVLKEGKNDVLVEYYFSKNTSVKTHLHINAKEPEIYKISAEYIGKNNNVDAELSNEDFRVTAIYEDDSRNDINEFAISYEKLKFGENDIKIIKSNLLCVVNLNCIDINNIERSEVEDNNSLDNANNIETNVQYVGRISDENDIDYYKFNILSDGKIRISFSHQKIDEEDIYWEVSLMSMNEEEKLDFESNGTTSEEKSSIIRLQSGCYYVKVAPYYHSKEKYKIKIEFEEELNEHEVEPNDKMESESTSILTNKYYVGNL